jgi:hypothetical protein
VALDPVHDLFGKGIDLAGLAEGAVAQVAAGAACDLAEFGRRQLPVLVAVELAVLREGDMVDVEIEPHADGVGGDQEVDVAGLVEFDLRVAGARRQRAQNDRRAAALAPDQFADGIDLVGGEGDDRRAARQARDLLLAGMGQMRHARPGDHGQPAQQLFQDAAHGAGAQQQRLVTPAQMQDAVGEDVPALHVGGQLHLVDRHEGGVGLARHRLHGADRIARAGRARSSPRR